MEDSEIESASASVIGKTPVLGFLLRCGTREPHSMGRFWKPGQIVPLRR